MARQRDRAIFFREFLRHPRQIGSVVPSSTRLEQRVVRAGGVQRARSAVELGPGTGGITRAILGALSTEASLLSLDINPVFCERLRRIGDPRLRIQCGSALDLEQALETHDLPPPDVVVAGIPFSTIDADTGRAILGLIARLLAPGGRFVSYQLRDTVAGLAEPFLGRPRVELELRSMPPQRVFSWQKDGVRYSALSQQ